MDRGDIRLMAVLAVALTAGAGPVALQAQAEGDAADRSVQGFWQWALADVAGGDEFPVEDGTVRIPPSPGGGDDEDARGRRPGPPDHARAGGRGRGGKARGPAFCRSGTGHPVHGRRWCLEKGFGLGAVPWRRVDPGEIFLQRDGPAGDRLGLDELVDAVGREALEGILGRADADGRLDEVTGRWREVDGVDARVLQLRVGRTPLAELNDLDRDGRVDATLLFGPNR